MIAKMHPRVSAKPRVAQITGNQIMKLSQHSWISLLHLKIVTKEYKW